MGILLGMLTFLLVLICLALIGLILIQRGKGGGLAGALGGSGVEQAFGTHAATMAQKATAVLAVMFLTLTIFVTWLYNRPTLGETMPGSGAPTPTIPASEPPATPPASGGAPETTP